MLSFFDMQIYIFRDSIQREINVVNYLNIPPPHSNYDTKNSPYLDQGYENRMCLSYVYTPPKASKDKPFRS